MSDGRVLRRIRRLIDGGTDRLLHLLPSHRRTVIPDNHAPLGGVVRDDPDPPVRHHVMGQGEMARPPDPTADSIPPHPPPPGGAPPVPHIPRASPAGNGPATSPSGRSHPVSVSGGVARGALTA